MNLSKLLDNNIDISEIFIKLEKLGEEVNCHDGTFNAYDLLENAEIIERLLNEFLNIKINKNHKN